MQVPGIVSRHAVVVRQGLRMAVAATIAMGVVELLGLPAGFWAPLSALAVLQGQIGASVVAARNYVIANLTGVLLGAFIVATFGKQLLVAGVGIFLIASLVTAMRLPPASASTAAAIVPVLVLTVQGNPWRYGGYRIIDILIGMASAIVVSLVLFPARAVVQLRSAVAGAITDATGCVAGALRATAAGERAPDTAEVEVRGAGRLETAQGLLPAARLEPLRHAAAHDLLPFYLSHAERIFERAAAVEEATAQVLPPEAVQALATPLGAVADAVEAAGGAIAAAVGAGAAGTPMADARRTLETLHAALGGLHAVDLTAVAQGDALIRAHSLVGALNDLADELERTLTRIEQPEETVTTEERARMASGVRPAAGAEASWWRRLRA